MPLWLSLNYRQCSPRMYLFFVVLGDDLDFQIILVRFILICCQYRSETFLYLFLEHLAHGIARYFSYK